MQQKECIAILSGKVARELLRRGYVIQDVKPNRNNTDKSVFMFVKEDGIYDAMNAVL